MMIDEPQLFACLAAAYVRGKLVRQPEAVSPPALFGVPLDTLDEADLQALILLGCQRGLRLHRFKRSMGLPRVNRVLGILRGIGPTDLLDAGSGRGAFLWSLLDAFPRLPVTALDRLDYRVADIHAVHDGGMDSLAAVQGDVTPSQPDNNPGHIHLFNAATLAPLLREAGAARVTFDYVPGHIIAVAKVGR